MSGASTTNLTLNSVTDATANTYYLVATGTFATTTNSLLLSVEDVPVFTSSAAQSTTLGSGTNAIFSVSLTAGAINPVSSIAYSPAPTYQWYNATAALSDGPGITGSLTPTLTVKALDANANSYYVIASNFAGSDQNADSA